MHRFFASSGNEIRGEEAQHLNRVLRLSPGDEIEVLQDGRRQLARLCQVGRELATFELLHELPDNEPQTKITLYQGVCKGEKMEFIAQKCTEMGVHRIVPVLMERTELKFLSPGRMDRIRRITKEAVKQCGRSHVPTVEDVAPFDAALISMSLHSQLLMPYEEGGQPLTGPIGRDVGILIGPEGGIAPDEAQRVLQVGGQALTLGPRILRTETAGLVALSVAMHLGGELEGKP